MSNGCGCESGLFKYVKPPQARLFYPACVIHDDAYDIGGDSAARKRADEQLYRNCIIIINRRNDGLIKRFYLRGVAALYYVSVRLFGRAYFRFTGK